MSNVIGDFVVTQASRDCGFRDDRLAPLNRLLTEQLDHNDDAAPQVAREKEQRLNHRSELLYLLAFLGGLLTILSPYILPVLPLVFSRADQLFRRTGLPLLGGMTVTFSAVAGVATYAGAWLAGARGGV